MERTLWSLAAAALAVLGAGCGGGGIDAGNPLVGSWETAFSSAGITGTETYQVNADGTLSYSLSASGTCSGSLTWSGYLWSSTATSVAFSGTPVCSGSATCGALTYSCSLAMSAAPTSGACDYALSNGDDTLALTNCTGTSNVTLLRAN